MTGKWQHRSRSRKGKCNANKNKMAASDKPGILRRGGILPHLSHRLLQLYEIFILKFSSATTPTKNNAQSYL